MALRERHAIDRRVLLPGRPRRWHRRRWPPRGLLLLLLLRAVCIEPRLARARTDREDRVVDQQRCGGPRHGPRPSRRAARRRRAVRPREACENAREQEGEQQVGHEHRAQ